MYLSDLLSMPFKNQQTKKYLGLMTFLIPLFLSACLHENNSSASTSNMTARSIIDFSCDLDGQSISDADTPAGLGLFDHSLSISVNGEGFLTLRGDDNTISYSRMGLFGLAADGDIVNQHGLRLQVSSPLSTGGFASGTLNDVNSEDFIGDLSSIAIDDIGRIYNIIDDEKKSYGKIVLTQFPNTQSLEKAQDCSWLETFDAGTPRTGEAGTSDFGLIALAESNNVGIDDTLDLAVKDGRYLVTESQEQNFYQKEGIFITDRDGFLMNTFGHRLQAFPPLADGSFSQVLSDVQILTTANPPSATRAITLSINLNVEAEVIGISPFDPGNDNSSSYSTEMLIFDSFGQSHSFHPFFIKTSNENQWQVFYVIASGEKQKILGPYLLEFIIRGGIPFAIDSIHRIDSINMSGGAAPLDLQIDLSGVDLSSSSFNLSKIHQDGYATGRLNGMEIDSCGDIIASFSNGQDRPIGSVALANFPQPEHLTLEAEGLYSANENSGQAILNQVCPGVIDGDTM